ncbi:MAG: tetratricopeptide repeat protein [Armatimonadetes bacterium]|nr:tetratricopeptide repeat protein [Armatimonadota bacterium]
MVAVVALIAILVLLGEVAWFSDSVQDWWIGRQSLAQLERLVEADTGSPRTRYYYAEALMRQGRYREALDQAGAGAAMDPSAARLLRVAGLAAQASGNPAEARILLRRARELGDHTAPLLEGLAILEMDRGYAGVALELLDESVRRYPNRAESWHLLGHCRGKLGMPKGAVEAVQHATRLAPGEPRYWVGLAKAWLFHDRPDEALRAADRALSLAPDDANARLARAMALAGQARTGPEIAQAETAFRQAVECPRTDASTAGAAWREFGKFLLEQGRPSEAIPPLQRALEEAPQDNAATYALARAYRRLGAVEKAQALLRQVEKRGVAPR